MDKHLIYQELRKIKQSVGMDTAILSHVYQNNYEVVAIVTDIPLVKEGAVLPLQSRLCMEVIRKNRIIHYHHIFSIEELREHPVYKALQPEAYVGCPVYVDRKLWGTINTMSLTPKLQGFTDQQLNVVKNAATVIGHSIESLAEPFHNKSCCGSH